MSPRYRLPPSAQRDVDQITDFIAADNVEAALRVHPDLTVRPVKFWSVYSYLVVYDPASTPLTVIAVLHGARDAGNLLKS